MLNPTTMILMLLGAPEPGPAPAPPPTPTVAELITKLEACEDEACPALRALIARGDKVWPDLDQGLTHPTELVRFWSIGVLSESPVPAARARLLTFIKDEPLTRIRAASAFALAAYPGADVSQALAAALADFDPNVRFEAASAIGRRAPDASVIAPLVKVLDDADEDVRAAVAEALGAQGGLARTPAVSKALVAKINDRKAPVRGRVAIAVGQIKIAEAVAPLIKRADLERDAEALAAMAWALGELGDASALEPLKKLTKHTSEVVKKHAEEAIAKLTVK